MGKRLLFDSRLGGCKRIGFVIDLAAKDPSATSHGVKEVAFAKEVFEGFLARMKELVWIETRVDTRFDGAVPGSCGFGRCNYDPLW